MKINTKVFLLLFFICFLPLVLLMPSLMQESYSTLPPEFQVNTMKPPIQLAFLTAYMISAIVCGYYFYFNTVRTRMHGVVIGLLGFFLFPFIGMAGIILTIPFLLISLYQWLIAHRTCYIVTTKGIQDGQNDPSMNAISDMQVREMLTKIIKIRSRRKIPLIILILASFLLLGSKEITPGNYSISLGGVNFLLYLIIVFILAVLYAVMMNKGDAKLLAPVIELLYEECDPYRTTQILDYLLDHKQLNISLCQYYLICSLKEQDNKSRIRQLLQIKNKLYHQTPVYITASFYCLDEAEQKRQWDSYHLECVKAIETTASKLGIEESIVQEKKQELSVRHLMSQGNYAQALQEASQIADSTKVTKAERLHRLYDVAVCHYQLSQMEEASHLFKRIIEEGNTLALCEFSRDYLKKINDLKTHGEQLQMPV